MHFIIVIAFLILLFFVPQIWASRTFKRYSKPLNRIPGSGGELARHLLDKMDMHHVKVETTKEGGDHYDPEDRAVRLSSKNHDDHSLTAIAVAAHEVGHAIQHHQKDKKLLLRTRLVTIAAKIQRLGAMAMVFIPVIILLTRLPHTGILLFVAGFLSMGTAAIIHMVTLPVELDASFNKALPILSDYIDEKDVPAIHKILKAAAFTYVAASLASLLNIWRWIALLRRA